MTKYLQSTFVRPSQLLLAVFAVGAFAVLSSTVIASEHSEEISPLSPPATPLVACDPYFSIWSTGRNLTDVETTHWTGRPHRLRSLVRVDGQAYRVMGGNDTDLPALKQSSLSVTPTRSMYQFQGAGVALKLTFMTPSLPEDIDLLSRPVTYVTYELQSTDGKKHDVAILFTAGGELAVNDPQHLVSTSAVSGDDFEALKLGSVQQNVLGHHGDDIRIEWGYLYLAAQRESFTSKAIGNFTNLAQDFAAGKSVADSSLEPAEHDAEEISLALEFKAKLTGERPKTLWLVLAYDDLYSIEYMHAHLRPYWRRDGLDALGLLDETIQDYSSLAERCEKFDRELMSDLEAAGGLEYARLAALAYRQCFAAGKFVADANGQPIQFSKENHSNGCIATSDVFYPMSPQFLLFGPSLAKSFVVPFMEYAASDRWKFPFAPHDLGTYPKANGQVYGGGEKSEENQMPVEESGNMLILMAAIAKLDGNADFAGQYWPLLKQWAEYLKQEGYDPDNQLCTDDFAGHMAHNVNLSAKAICGLGAFAQLCELRGESELASKYRATLEEFAAKWIAEADDGDHFRLAFDQPSTWSQKYNLVWDRVLDLGLFPDSVLHKEMSHYRQVQNRYGLPLDSRKAYTKLDWILWSATLTQNREDFQALVKPVYRFLQETPDRAPMTDWYETDSGKKVGFTARPVVGGVFMQLLYNESVWKKWAASDKTRSGGFAEMPIPPVVKFHVPAADTSATKWRYTMSRPDSGWYEPNFDDSNWLEGPAGFGTTFTPGVQVGTVWDTSDIWARRTFDLPAELRKDLKLHVHYDEDAEIYINGVLAKKVRGFTTSYQQIPIRTEALDAIQPTGNVLAVHCRQTRGGQYIDVGFATLEKVETAVE